MAITTMINARSPNPIPNPNARLLSVDGTVTGDDLLSTLTTDPTSAVVEEGEAVVPTLLDDGAPLVSMTDGIIVVPLVIISTKNPVAVTSTLEVVDSVVGPSVDTSVENDDVSCTVPVEASVTGASLVTSRVV